MKRLETMFSNAKTTKDATDIKIDLDLNTRFVYRKKSMK